MPYVCQYVSINIRLHLLVKVSSNVACPIPENTTATSVHTFLFHPKTLSPFRDVACPRRSCEVLLNKAPDAQGHFHTLLALHASRWISDIAEKQTHKLYMKRRTGIKSPMSYSVNSSQAWLHICMLNSNFLGGAETSEVCVGSIWQGN